MQSERDFTEKYESPNKNVINAKNCDGEQANMYSMEGALPNTQLSSSPINKQNSTQSKTSSNKYVLSLAPNREIVNGLYLTEEDGFGTIQNDMLSVNNQPGIKGKSNPLRLKGFEMEFVGGELPTLDFTAQTHLLSPSLPNS